MSLLSNGNCMNLLRLLIFAGSLALTERSRASDSESLITKICLLNFDSEMSLAKKQPPKGMSDFTCNCFINKVSNGYSIKASKEKCKTEASRKFNFEKD